MKTVAISERKGKGIVLKYILEKIEGTKYYYLYFPEGNMNAAGMVVIDYDNDVRAVITQSDDDYNHVYAIHAMHGVSKGQEKGTIAWY